MELIVAIVVLAVMTGAYFRMHRQSLSQQKIAAKDSMLMHACSNLLEKIDAADSLAITADYMDIRDYDTLLSSEDLDVGEVPNIKIKVEKSGDLHLIYIVTGRTPIRYCLAREIK